MTRVAVLGHPELDADQAVAGLIGQLGLQAVPLASSDADDTAFFERVARLRDLQFAIVLVPASALDPATGLPKPNLPTRLLELGYLLGTLGRGRVCLLVSGQPRGSTWDGLTNLTLDDEGLWHLLLARVMKQAGLDVDLNRAI